ncbi:hypothetical protein AR457_14835 [Streptomyces agglomeratus]|uniref:Uncharacterized protein n=1 Tax=Streptomyces agglomeratus TaxID=285458 RepID=A0A1E5P7N4_9ACTN|nr:hypothetical protein [Streptomyces agglomeratus]OEJ25553.1 hypothetical protein AS594_14650 [Streptomyces agglomeratus]OEJ40409.1 hypothetical protein BGK70_21820 [Streptomyces agglomeratus]OEJ45213.1 hypothetical protein AR457_14835 [Streptomyces agglomeratus]OEJ52960.1 hypothetical protein BGK72_21460 [Streptomyces agglomeratus]OEJ60296.1 hypothetical protein BGM19_22165 [Streptomyces agglomeratus]
MDLLDWHRGRLSTRRLAVLVRHMPRDSAVARALHGEAAEWSVTDYLLATTVDQLAEANWMFATVNQDEDAEPLEYPAPVPRPSDGPADEPESAEPTADGAGQPQRPGVSELSQFFA